LEELKDEAQGRSDVLFFDKYLSPYETSSLIELSDVFISLHRSEGYGINLADAIARKTAVIATGYSGNLEFMDPRFETLVPYELVAVTEYAGYKLKSVWAEPDIEWAAMKLKEFYNNADSIRNSQLGAYLDLKEKFSLQATTRKFRMELSNV
jgi:glycosyltransferase involved in cell wall biosynthesis